MPEIDVHMVEGRTLDQNRALIRDITESPIGAISPPRGGLH